MFLANGMKVLRRMTYFNTLAVSPKCRKLATERTNFISVTIDPEFDGTVAIVKMRKKPVNLLCSNLFQELIKTIDDLENNENIRAMILTSAFPGVFSAGLDINFLLDATYDDVYNFWMEHLQEAVLKFYGSKLISICALNVINLQVECYRSLDHVFRSSSPLLGDSDSTQGHCIAGGNLLALAADFRVMAHGLYRIGMNETQLGFTVPFYLREMLENLIGPKLAARALQLSLIFTSEEACKLGWVDEVVQMDQVLTVARSKMKQWLEIPDSGRILTKMDIRGKLIQEIIHRRQEDAQLCANLVARPDVKKK